MILRPLMLLFTVITCITAQAGSSVNVCPAGCDFSNIQSAVNGVGPGGTVSLPMSVPHTESDIFITKDVTVMGVDRFQTIVQAAAQPDLNAGRVFTILPGHTVTFSDFTIRHGGTTDGDGGGIWIQPSDSQSVVTLKRMNITGNSAANCGGIFNEARLIMQNFSVTQNSVFGASGGGIANTEFAELFDGEISNNYAEVRGGGISSLNSEGTTPTLFLQGLSIRGNRAGHGGGIFHSGEALAMIENSKIDNNRLTRQLVAEY